MTDESEDAVRAFVTDVEAQARAREQDPNYTPSDNEKARRESVMQDLLGALGLDKKELQTRLRLDKSTWDRWRAMGSIPHKSHLLALERFAQETARADDEPCPKPLEMLQDGPRTWACLRLVYALHRLDNLILHFKKPWNDVDTAVEMAHLALKNTCLIYFETEPEQWWDRFRAQIVSALGKTYAARALSKVCLIRRELPEDMPQFAIFDYEAKRPEDRAGYIWRGGEKRPPLEQKYVYDGVPGSHDLFEEVHERYSTAIQQALHKILVRKLPEFWSIDFDRNALLNEIPIVTDDEDNSNVSRSGRKRRN